MIDSEPNGGTQQGFLTIVGNDGRRSKNPDDTFLDLLRLHADLWKLAFDRKIICCPIAASLGEEMSKEQIMSHILLPGRFPCEYLTLRGETVRIDGGELITLDGFSEQRKIRIMSAGHVGNTGR